MTNHLQHQQPFIVNENPALMVTFCLTETQLVHHGVIMNVCLRDQKLVHNTLTVSHAFINDGSKVFEYLLTMMFMSYLLTYLQ